MWTKKANGRCSWGLACAVSSLMVLGLPEVVAAQWGRGALKAGRNDPSIRKREGPGQPPSSSKFSSALSAVSLERTLLAVSDLDKRNGDNDSDGLFDPGELNLAHQVRPYCIFDSAEKARQPHEPVTLFQVRPLNLSNDSGLRIKIKWVFLFRRDGGYGPDCTVEGWDDHDGDNDTAFYELRSHDDGLTWKIVRIGLGGEGGLEWRPGKTGLKVYRRHHPVIYMSAHKHHEYFTTTYDHKDSLYSRPVLGIRCNDDVNGRGARVLVNVRSLPRFLFGNNVGEPDCHPAPLFVNDLSDFYRGHSAWGKKDFYDSVCGTVRRKWMTHGWYRTDGSYVGASSSGGQGGGGGADADEPRRHLK